MSFDVDIHKIVRSARSSFDLRVCFKAPAQRTVIFGPSGAGKGLTLQAVAGLLTPDGGRIAFNDEVLFDAAANTLMCPRAVAEGAIAERPATAARSAPTRLKVV